MEPKITGAKRRALDAYNAKCDYIAIKPQKEHGAQIRQAAKDAGQSLQRYILDAVADRMAAESQEGVTVCKIRNDAVGPAAEAAGQSIKEYVTQAIQERMERER